MLDYNPPKTSLNAGPFKIFLDCAGEISFVSHAHFDHATGLNSSKTIIASEATADLLEARGISTAGLDFQPFFGRGGVKIELLDSGHVLGSSMMYAEFDSTSFLYTGDFKLQDSLIGPAAKPKKCEWLLIETTYGSPEYKFPERREVYADLSRWVSQQQKMGHSTVFGGYSLGKAQELVKVLNEFVGVAPIVSEEIAKVCKVYEKHGVRLDVVRSGTEEAEEILRHRFTAVLPHHQVGPELAKNLAEHYGRPVATALATGWAAGSKRMFSADAVFPLSDHCDFDHLLKFVEACEPEKIVCNHGFEKEFSAELRKRGWAAVAISELGKTQQKALAEYG